MLRGKFTEHVIFAAMITISTLGWLTNTSIAQGAMEKEIKNGI